MGLIYSLGPGRWWNLVAFTGIGASAATGLLIRALARPRRKPIGQKLSLALIGLSLYLSAGVFGRQSFQLEGPRDGGVTLHARRPGSLH